MISKTKALALGVAGLLGVASSGAMAVGDGLPFTVSEGVVPGVPGANDLAVDSFDFSYTAVIEQTNDGGVLNGDFFGEKGFFEASSFKNGTDTPGQFLNSPAIAGGYGMYGIFELTGNDHHTIIFDDIAQIFIIYSCTFCTPMNIHIGIIP